MEVFHMGSTGKIVGGLIGFAFGGPAGAAVGADIGHYLADKDNSLKYLSMATGSSQETLLNARAEMSNAIGSKSLSHEKERLYVFEKLNTDMQNHGSSYINYEEIKHMPIEVILPYMSEYYQDTKQNEYMQIVNRVLVYFYNYELGNHDSLVKALTPFTYDFIDYLSKH